MVTEGQIKPRGLGEHGLVVREGIEARFTVVRTHAAFANAAKTHFARGEVDYGVVYTTTAKGKPIGNSLNPHRIV